MVGVKRADPGAMAYYSFGGGKAACRDTMVHGTEGVHFIHPGREGCDVAVARSFARGVSLGFGHK